MGKVRIAVAAALLLVVAGCGGGDESPESSSTPSQANATTSASDDASSDASGGSSPVADPEHAVDPPGPLTDRLYPADLLVFNDEPLSPAMVEQITRLEGVAAVESMGLGQRTIENRAINVAAVDPGTYRRFTPSNSAQLQEAWQRVAGGEIAITRGLGKRMEDKHGSLTMGGETDAPTIHIGAFAPQAEQIDAVVNQKWGEDLGLADGNALLISTDRVAPESVRKPIEKIVGDDVSVQRLDVAARLGLDTSVQQTAFLTGGSVADVVGTFNYTVLGGGRIAPEASWTASHIATEVMPIIGPMTCNKAIFPQLRAALDEVVTQGLAGELHPDEYAGCYYPRFIAGTTTLSNHSFGTAMDFNVPGNQRGTVGEMDRRVVAIFKKWGFAWGGDWNYTDPMHFEMNEVVDPR